MAEGYAPGLSEFVDPTDISDPFAVAARRTRGAVMRNPDAVHLSNPLDLVSRLPSVATAAADFGGVPSALIGTVSPRARDAIRGVYEDDPAAQALGSVLTPAGLLTAPGKGAIAAAKEAPGLTTALLAALFGLAPSELQSGEYEDRLGKLIDAERKRVGGGIGPKKIESLRQGLTEQMKLEAEQRRADEDAKATREAKAESVKAERESKAKAEAGAASARKAAIAKLAEELGISPEEASSKELMKPGALNEMLAERKAKLEGEQPFTKRNPGTTAAMQLGFSVAGGALPAWLKSKSVAGLEKYLDNQTRARGVADKAIGTATETIAKKGAESTPAKAMVSAAKQKTDVAKSYDAEWPVKMKGQEALDKKLRHTGTFLGAEGALLPNEIDIISNPNRENAYAEFAKPETYARLLLGALMGTGAGYTGTKIGGRNMPTPPPAYPTPRFPTR